MVITHLLATTTTYTYTPLLHLIYMYTISCSYLSKSDTPKKDGQEKLDFHLSSAHQTTPHPTPHGKVPCTHVPTYRPRALRSELPLSYDTESMNGAFCYFINDASGPGSLYPGIPTPGLRIWPVQKET